MKLVVAFQTRGILEALQFMEFRGKLKGWVVFQFEI